MAKCEPGCQCNRHVNRMTPEIAAKISATKMGHAVSDETRAKIGAAGRGRKPAPETIARQSDAQARHGHARNGRARSPEYRAWDGMKQRCLNPNASRFDDYGGRGITVCERWMVFENFLADMGEKPEPKSQYSIDRIDGDGNYEPGNAQWSTRSAQQKNRPNFDASKARKCPPGCTCGKHTAPGRRGYPR